jgi:hypothetical protein
MNSIFQYNGDPVTFRNENGKLFVNATEMAKQFDARPGDWLRTEPSQRIIQAIVKTHICTLTDLVQVTKG